MTFNDNDRDDSQDDVSENPWAQSNDGISQSGEKKLQKNNDNISPFPKKDTQQNYFLNSNTIDDLMDKVQSFWRKENKKNSEKVLFKGNNPRGFGFFVISAILLLVGVWLFSGFFRVQEGELALVLRFGKLNRISHPGLRYRLPEPIETEIIRNVAVLNKIDGGLKSDSGRSSESQEQNLILTGDENMVHTNYTVLWKIKDISDFIFIMRDPENTIRVAAESAIREVLGQTTARLALTEGRETIGAKSQDLLQRILDNYKAGVQIVSVQLQRVEPPMQVVQAFNDMQASLVDADRLRNEAEAYRNDKIPRARGKAKEIVKAAEAYQQQVVAQTKGEIARFNAFASAYHRHPEVTLKRHYFETMQKVLNHSNKTIISSNLAGGKGNNSIIPYLNLQPPKKTKVVSAVTTESRSHEVTAPSVNLDSKKG